MSTPDGSVAALHSNAAGQQGVQAALLVVLDMAAGGGSIDLTSGLPIISVEHVNAARRLVDISVSIREMWRQGLDDAMSAGGDGDSDDGRPGIARAVLGNYTESWFDQALSTQLPVAKDEGRLPTPTPPVSVAGQQEHAIWRSQAGDTFRMDEEPDVVPHCEDAKPLLFDEFPAQESFDQKGLGPGGKDVDVENWCSAALQ